MSLETRISSLATQIGTDIKNLRETRGSLAALTTTEKTNLVGALNELKTSIDAATSSAVGINDAATVTTATWSSSKISTNISAAVADLVASAPGALDTLNELAAALGNDASFATTTATALGNRIRVDAVQTFTAPQQAQALSNIGAAASVHTHVVADVTGLQAALDLKAPLASPALTGTPTAPTATAGTNTTQLATTAFVTAGLATKAATAHTHVIADTTGLQTALDAKAPLASPALTGTPTAPTALAGNSTTQVATTAFVAAGLALKADSTTVSALSTSIGNADADVTAIYVAARDAV